MESKVVNTLVNPTTGDSTIINDKVDNLESTLEEKASKAFAHVDISSNMSKLINANEFSESLLNDDNILKDLTKGMTLEDKDVKQILEVTNRVIKKEKINVFKELPVSVQEAIDKNIKAQYLIPSLDHKTNNMIRKSIANSIINEFISNIQNQRAKYDFAHELANIYEEGTKDIENAAMELHKERNKAYRDIANDMEDGEKKQRLNEVLDSIDEARNLTKLKEFTKKCKIKSIDLEKPKRIFNDFLNKYRNSSNNIYDINMGVKSLLRTLNTEEEKYTIDHINAFFIAFCKQTINYKESDPIDHAYMYYVLYYSMLSDTEDSKEFLTNVAKVIDNIVERNPERFK